MRFSPYYCTQMKVNFSTLSTASCIPSYYSTHEQEGEDDEIELAWLLDRKERRWKDAENEWVRELLFPYTNLESMMMKKRATDHIYFFGFSTTSVQKGRRPSLCVFHHLPKGRQKIVVVYRIMRPTV